MAQLCRSLSTILHLTCQRRLVAACLYFRDSFKHAPKGLALLSYHRQVPGPQITPHPTPVFPSLLWLSMQTLSVFGACLDLSPCESGAPPVTILNLSYQPRGHQGKALLLPQTPHKILSVLDLAFLNEDLQGQSTVSYKDFNANRFYRHSCHQPALYLSTGDRHRPTNYTVDRDLLERLPVNRWTSDLPSRGFTYTTASFSSSF